MNEKTGESKKINNGLDDTGIGSASSSDGLDAEQHHQAPEWEDVLGSGELFRKVVVPGTGDRRPINGDLVIIRVEGQLENGQKVDCCDELPFLIGHSEVIPAFDLCVPFMTVGEVDSMRVFPRFGYGKAGKDNEIPPDATITYEIQLLSIENGPNPADMSIDDRLAWVDKKKQRGNYYFQREEYTSAVDVYNRALSLVEPNLEDTENDRRRLVDAGATLYNNLAAAQLKIEAWNAAIQSLRHVVSAQPKNVKAHFRMAKAYMGQGDYENAIEKLNEVLALDPENKAIQSELTRASILLKRENEASKTLYKKMFSKPISQTEKNGNSMLTWLKDHCTLANGTMVAAVTAGVLLLSHSLMSRYFN